MLIANTNFLRKKRTVKIISFLALLPLLVSRPERDSPNLYSNFSLFQLDFLTVMIIVLIAGIIKKIVNIMIDI